MAKPLEFIPEREPWNVYLLDNGTELRVRLVLTRIERNGTDPNGKPAYNFDHVIITQVEACNSEKVKINGK